MRDYAVVDQSSMKNPKKPVLSHDQPSQKRKQRPVNDENDNHQAQTQKSNSRRGVVLEDVTNIPHLKSNWFFLLCFFVHLTSRIYMYLQGRECWHILRFIMIDFFIADNQREKHIPPTKVTRLQKDERCEWTTKVHMQQCISRSYYASIYVYFFRHRTPDA